MRLQGLVRLTIAQATMLRRNVGFWLTSMVIALISILVFGWLFNPGLPRPFDLALVDEDGTRASAALVAAFESLDNVDVVKGKREAEFKSLRSGDRAAVLVVPAGFEADLAEGAATVDAHFDVSDDPIRTSYVQSTIAATIAAFNEEVGVEQEGVKLAKRSVATENVRYIDFLTPGMVGMTIMWMNLGVGFLLVTWREQGILRRLGVTPLRSGSLIVTQALSFAMVSVTQVTIIFGIAHFMFGVAINGSLLWLVVSVVLGIASMLSIGYVLGSFITGAATANATVNALAFPMLFLGGSYFPLEESPALSPLVNAIPLTHLNGALREAVNGSGDLSDLWGRWVALVIVTVVGFSTSMRAFRWQ